MIADMTMPTPSLHGFSRPVRRAKSAGSGSKARRAAAVLAGAVLLGAAVVVAPWRGALAQELDKGERVFKKCQACHSLDPAQQTDKGPALQGVFGRKAGTAPGFAYSEAMKAANIVWTEETLEAFLADSQGVVPGNTMNFSGLRKPEDRTAVIAYLREASK
ncbi:MAG: cytochrome c family protein [Rhodospirillales bacterium]|nr:cytochrome c family protein [Rhodospirillales bacterium]